MRIPTRISTLPLFGLLLGLVLNPAVAWSERPECEGIPPEGPAVCFIEEPFLGVFFESPMAEPEEMVLVLIEDPADDFVIAFPDGELFVHTPEREGEMIWCPFSFAEFDFENPQAECVFGTAKLQANGYIEPSGDLACPYTAHLTGTGLRGSDGVAFEVSTEMLLVPTKKKGGENGCRIVKDRITANPIP